MRHCFTESWKTEGEGGNEENTKSPEQREKQKLGELREKKATNEMQRKNLETEDEENRGWGE